MPRPSRYSCVAVMAAVTARHKAGRAQDKHASMRRRNRVLHREQEHRRAASNPLRIARGDAAANRQRVAISQSCAGAMLAHDCSFQDEPPRLHRPTSSSRGTASQCIYRHPGDNSASQNFVQNTRIPSEEFAAACCALLIPASHTRAPASRLSERKKNQEDEAGRKDICGRVGRKTIGPCRLLPSADRTAAWWNDLPVPASDRTHPAPAPALLSG